MTKTIQCISPVDGRVYAERPALSLAYTANDFGKISGVGRAAWAASISSATQLTESS